MGVYKRSLGLAAAFALWGLVVSGIFAVALTWDGDDHTRREAQCDLVGGAYIEGHCLSPHIVIKLPEGR